MNGWIRGLCVHLDRAQDLSISVMKYFSIIVAVTLCGFLNGALAKDAPTSKPVVAVVAYNPGTEVTDFLVPFGILADSALADVHAVALAAGPVTFRPAPGAVTLPATVAAFDAAYPRGADYVIVPAVVDPDAAALAAWLRAQHSKGAIIMSICDGAKVLAHAGLLKGRTATAHWYSLSELRRQFPETNWRDDRRYVFDEKVFTTSGVSASVPATFALLERIAGAEATARFANSLGVANWSAAHNGAAFMQAHQAWDAAAGARSPKLTPEGVGFALPEQFDEARAALVMDAYSRTHRSHVVLHSGTANQVSSRHGLIFQTNQEARAYEVDHSLLQQSLAQTLDAALNQIQRDYGVMAADHVALQLEYVRSRASTEKDSHDR
jgi:transcriptional regulator GlxA family with amidase domain